MIIYLETAKVFNDFGFYWTHRIFHFKSIYKLWHKKHHEFTGTVGFAAEYSHPLESLLSNYLPTISGVLFFGSHPLCIIVWIGIRLKQSYEFHSGYCFAGTFVHDYLMLVSGESAAFHHHHHATNQGNFAVPYVDYLFGTMDHWMSNGGLDGYIKKKNRKVKKVE